MFRRIEKWFDTASDGWNPIVVRDLRRMSRSRVFLIVTFAHLGLLAVIHVADLKDPAAPDLFEIVSRIYPTVAAMLCAGLLSLDQTVRARLKDDSFDLTPLTPQDQVHGCLTTSLFLSAFFFVQALPFLAFPSTIPFGRLIRLGILCGGFVVSPIAVLYPLPFFAITKTMTEAVCMLFAAVYLGGLVLELPFILVFAFLWDVVLQKRPVPFEVMADWPFITIVSLLGVIASLSFVYLLYRLSLFQFTNRNGNCWMGLAVNLYFTGLWSCCWAVIGFVVAIAFSG